MLNFHFFECDLLYSHVEDLAFLMNSEESEEDGAFSVRLLPWRSKKATDLYSLDKKHEKRCSVRSKRMTFERRDGDVSDRERPVEGSVPEWCLT